MNFRKSGPLAQLEWSFENWTVKQTSKSSGDGAGGYKTDGGCRQNAGHV